MEKKETSELKTSEKTRSRVKQECQEFYFISDDLILITASPFSSIYSWHKLFWNMGFWVTVSCSYTVDIKSTHFYQIVWQLRVTEWVTSPCRENSTPWMWPQPSVLLTWTGTSSPHRTALASFTTSWLVSRNSLQQPLFFFFYVASVTSVCLFCSPKIIPLSSQVIQRPIESISPWTRQPQSCWFCSPLAGTCSIGSRS